MIEQIKSRITEIEEAIKNLVAQHSTLVGHLNEAKNFLAMAEEAGDKAEEVIEEVKD